MYRVRSRLNPRAIENRYRRTGLRGVYGKRETASFRKAAKVSRRVVENTRRLAAGVPGV